MLVAVELWSVGKGLYSRCSLKSFCYKLSLSDSNARLKDVMSFSK